MDRPVVDELNPAAAVFPIPLVVAEVGKLPTPEDAFVMMSDAAIGEGGSFGTYYLIVGLLCIISEIFSTGS